MADGGGINLRLSLKGAEQVRGELATLGPAGSKAARELDRAMRQPTAGMRALDGGVREVNSGLEAFAGRAGPVGNLLQQFGPWGLAAAAGMAALVVAATAAVQVSNQAATAAASLTDTAGRIGIGVEALQQWRYVADEAGVPVQTLESDLEKLNGTLGKFKIGIGDAKLKPWFQELGIKKEDLDSIETADQMMLLLADRLGQITDRSKQVAAARAFGVEDSLPALRLGSEALRDLLAASEELGVVLEKETVEKLDAAERKAELAGQQLKTLAFSAVEPLTTALANAGAMLGNLSVKFDNIESKAPTWVRWLNALGRAMPGTGGLQRIGELATGGIAPPSAGQGDMYSDEHEMAGMRAALQGSGDSGFELEGHGNGGGGGGGGPSEAERQQEQKRREGERALEQLTRLEIQIQRANVSAEAERLDTAEARADAALALLQMDEREAAIEVARLRSALQAADMDDEAIERRIVQLKSLRATMRADKEEAIAAEHRERARQAAAEAERIHADTLQTILQFASAEARTAGERRAIETQILELAQRRQKADLEAAIEAEKEPAKRAALVEALSRLPEIQAGQTRDMQRRTAGPVEAWRDAQFKSAGEAGEYVTGQALDALDNLNGGLIDAWRNADNAGEAFSNMGRVAVDALDQVADALLKIALQRMLIEPLGNALFGSGQEGGSQGLLGSFISNFTGRVFGGASGGLAPTGGGLPTGGAPASVGNASGVLATMRLLSLPGRGRGGVVGGGGLHKVGEYGMELMDLPAGARIYDTDRTQRIMSDFDARMRSQGGGGSAAAPTVNMPITVVNQSSAQVEAQPRPMPGGGFQIVLQDAVKGAVRGMGADGSLMRSLSMTPQARRR
ncbi:hypothetical protein KOAAANKH_00095 [Brevundimonas sp. NIBR10]|uniref:hypothetical protein n=1 Tax=Brevundimonas sp. NIBR10 TaxID=3015997 RepID=UPI0022F1699F|nr:hypothetical protein [Brevundimonas sp. NIBR10]WGM45234.1 hypothetical protein KOAAANKH_00095 [Brevundimonas sp. NIBR10]